MNSPSQKTVSGLVVLIWSEVLGCDQIRWEDNFFALGGDSLLASIAVVNLAEKTGLSLSVYDLFANPTLREMVGLLETRQALSDEERIVSDSGIWKSDD